MGRGMSRHHRGLGARWERTRRGVLERAGWRCEGCQLARPLEAHHIKPLYMGGAVYAASNLRALCRECHHAAHARAESPARKRWRAFAAALSS